MTIAGLQRYMDCILLQPAVTGTTAVCQLVCMKPIASTTFQLIMTCCKSCPLIGHALLSDQLFFFTLGSSMHHCKCLSAL